MGIYDRDYNSEYDKFVKRKSIFNFSGNSLFTLIAINLLVFVGLQMLNLVYFFVDGKEAGAVVFDNQIMRQFVLPADWNKLLYKPWTVITYMFTHFGLFHIFANMLWLWAFGSILKDLSGDKHIVPVYIIIYSSQQGVQTAALFGYQTRQHQLLFHPQKNKQGSAFAARQIPAG